MVTNFREFLHYLHDAEKACPLCVTSVTNTILHSDPTRMLQKTLLINPCHLLVDLVILVGTDHS